MVDCELIECKVCGRKLKKITNTHLKLHNMTSLEYEKKYPNARFESDELAFGRQEHKLGKTYEEIYGVELAQKMKGEKRKRMTKYNVEKRMCKICKNVFLAKENSTQVYCSYKCSYEGLQKEKKLMTCINCGSHFYDYPSSESKYCSVKCSEQYRYEICRTKHCCSMCGKELNIKIRDIKHNHNIFCSNECKKKYGILKRKIDYKEKAFATYGRICSRCNTTKKLLVHHKDGNRLNNDIGNLIVYCRSCHSLIHQQVIELQKEFIGQADIESGMIRILFGLKKAFGLDITNENFRLTPKRVARAYYEIFKGINSDKELNGIASTDFPSEYDGMVIIDNIKCFSMCPHHFLPVEYIVDVGYIPNKKTVGLSKLIRVVELLAKAPELQEVFTKKISNILERELNPTGVIVQVRGRHFCMAMRGVNKPDSWTMTSSITGTFKDNPGTREEFMLLKGKR